MEINPANFSRSRIITLIRMTGGPQSLRKWGTVHGMGALRVGRRERGLGKIPPAGQFPCHLKVAATVKEAC